MNLKKAILEIKGNTSQEIAAFFAAEKVKGVQYSSTNCPVARYLTLKCENMITTGLSTAAIDTKDEEIGIIVESLPLAIQRFIRDFDDSKYPELELNPPRYVTPPSKE